MRGSVHIFYVFYDCVLRMYVKPGGLKSYYVATAVVWASCNCHKTKITVVRQSCDARLTYDNRKIATRLSYTQRTTGLRRSTS